MDLGELLEANRAVAPATGGLEPAARKDLGRAAGVEQSISSPTRIAATIAALWEDALGVEKVGEKDDFFALGGHSLSLVQVAAQLRREFDLDLPLTELIEQSSFAHWTRTVHLALKTRGGGE
jgi:acyl carrier protein